MSQFWLSFAVVFYGIGLVYSLVALRGRRGPITDVTLRAVGAGLIFHFVALIEFVTTFGVRNLLAAHQYESLLAFLLMAFFIGFYFLYRTTSPGIFVFPLVFLLTLLASIGSQAPKASSSPPHPAWIILHILLIFFGYAGLFFSFVASLLYLLQERTLKLKSPRGIFSRLPALEVIDEMGYRSLLLGFPFMTFGLVAGSIIAQKSFGAGFLLDPKILLSLLMWLAYTILLYTRSTGWRGRKAAILSTCAFLAAIGAGAADYLSSMHHFLT